MSKLKLGIYGGTFSPPHFGHIKAAKSFLYGVGLDRLLIMPDCMPPHKEEFGAASAEDRLAMCRLAFSNLERTEISDYEINRGGKSYTYLTLEAFASDNVELYFLCGTDMLLTLDKWKNPERIFELATICFIRRECDETIAGDVALKIAEFNNRFSARIIELDHDVFEASSTDIRRNIATCSARVLGIPDAVAEYISERGLYK